MIRLDSGTGSARKHPDGNMIPVINMTFLLLLFFIVAGSFSETVANKVFPPQSLSDTPASPMIEEFAVTAGGELQWQGRTTTAAQWSAELKAGGEAVPGVVRLRADGATPASVIIPLLDDFKLLSVRRVALVTVKRAAEGSAGPSSGPAP